MGFSVSASTLIIFLGLMVAASGMYGAWSFAQNELQTARDDNLEDSLNKKQTAIKIIGVTTNLAINTYTINVSNNGSTGLEINDTTVILDGNVVDNPDFKVKGVSDTDLWLPGEELQINVPRSSEPDRTKVVVENGVSDVFNNSNG